MCTRHYRSSAVADQILVYGFRISANGSFVCVKQGTIDRPVCILSAPNPLFKRSLGFFLEMTPVIFQQRDPQGQCGAKKISRSRVWPGGTDHPYGSDKSVESLGWISLALEITVMCAGREMFLSSSFFLPVTTLFSVIDFRRGFFSLVCGCLLLFQMTDCRVGAREGIENNHRQTRARRLSLAGKAFGVLRERERDKQFMVS